MLGNATLACLGPYTCDNVHVDARTVYTNNVPGGAYRGFGGPQGHFAAELQMDRLAEALDIDPLELRLCNAWREGSLMATRSVLPPGVTIVPVLERLAAEISTNENDEQSPVSSPHLPFRTSLDVSAGQRLRGVGIACCFKNVGGRMA